MRKRNAPLAWQRINRSNRNDTREQQIELAVYAKVYEAILTAPMTSAFREDDPGSEDEAPPDDPEMVVAIRADRFGLMTRIGKMRLAAAFGVAANDGVAPAPQCPKGCGRWYAGYGWRCNHCGETARGVATDERGQP